MFKIFSRNNDKNEDNGDFKMRFIVSDIEYQINWIDTFDDKRGDETIYFGLRYLMKQIGSFLNIEKLRLTNTRGQRITLIDIAKNRNKIVFVLSDHIKGVKTYCSLAPRSIQNSVFFKNDFYEMNFFNFAEKKMKKDKLEINLLEDFSADYVEENVKKRAEEAVEKRVLQPPQRSMLSKNKDIGLSDGKTLVSNQRDRNANVPDRKITLQELKMHSKRSDCWMAIKGVVYDCTDYVKRHPGGDVIMDAAGADGTQLFNKYHSWVNTAFLLRGKAVGKLDNSSNMGNFGNTLMI